jgi:mono/diheme cytochrome c family protein
MNPQTLRPALILRMPQFNMSQKEAETLADYIGIALQKPGVNPDETDAERFTPQLAALGKQLYEVKYQCQSCHTIGSTGGYVGPSLTNAGNWMTPAWIQSWLKDPQALVPGAIEPKRTFTQDEIDELTAYLLSLRQSAAPEKSAEAASGPDRLMAGK